MIVSISLLLPHSSRIRAISPGHSHTASLAPSQMIRQHLFLPQPVAGDCSSTDPVSDETTTDIYAPVLKQLIPTRKNNHMLGHQHGHEQQAEAREYHDIPLPKSVLQINLQNHENHCARYNYIMPPKNNLYTSTECVCQTSDDKQDVSSNRWVLASSINAILFSETPVSFSTYEDSLKDFATETTMTSMTTRFAQKSSFRQNVVENLDRRSNRHSFSGFHQMERKVKNSRRSSFMLGTNGNGGPQGYRRWLP